MLTAHESPDDYREVSDSEKAKLEAADAAWVEPPERVVRLFNEDPHGCYNEETGFFELNGLTDITTEQAEAIAFYGRPNIANIGGWYSISQYGSYPWIRTNLTPINAGNITIPYPSFAFTGQTRMEVCRISETTKYNEAGNFNTKGGSVIWGSCKALHSIIGGRITVNGGDDGIFRDCLALEEMKLVVYKDISLQYSPKLSLATMEYIVANAANSAAITVKVHAEVLAKMTGEWEGEMSEEEQTRWQALPELAAAKKITFITP